MSLIITDTKNKRRRGWALTINKSADCYNNLDEILNSNIGTKDFFAYINHDRDCNLETGEAVEEHYHLLLILENAKTFTAVQRIFRGAHIEPTFSKEAYANYLLHNGHPEKVQYSTDEVKSNNRELYLSFINQKIYETFDENKLPYYMFVEECDTFLKLCLRFGASQLPVGIISKVKQLNADYLNLYDEEQEVINSQLEDNYLPKSEDF